MRVSMHNGRSGSARHNDRDFDLNVEHAQHLTASKSSENLTWQPKKYQNMTFRDAELAYYRETFAASQEAKNERYIKQRHPERCKTIEQLYNAKQTKPEETILTIGDRNDGIDIDTFCKCINEYNTRLDGWNKEHGKPFHRLNIAIHVDEPGAIHAHMRRVWQYTDKDGNFAIGQNKALEAAGVPLPQPDKPENRYNNRKITFDKMSREIWQEVCKSHGLQTETEPRADGRKHERTADYIRKDDERAQRELQRTKKELEQTQRALKEQQRELEQQQRAFAEAKEQLREAEAQLAFTKKEEKSVQARLASSTEQADLTIAEANQVLEQARLQAERVLQALEQDTRKGMPKILEDNETDRPLGGYDWISKNVKHETNLLGQKTGNKVISEKGWRELRPFLDSVIKCNKLEMKMQGTLGVVQKAADTALKPLKSGLSIAKKLNTVTTELAKTKEELAAERASRLAAETAQKELEKRAESVGFIKARAEQLSPGFLRTLENCMGAAEKKGWSVERVIDELVKEAKSYNVPAVEHGKKKENWTFLSVFDKKKKSQQTINKYL